MREAMHDGGSTAGGSAIGLTIRRAKPAKAGRPKQALLVNLQACMGPVGEPAEVYVSVWNRPANRFLSEDYRINFTDKGMPTDLNKIGSIKTLFKVRERASLFGLEHGL